MGYSTTLYAVDLDALRAAVGSHDPVLIERAEALRGAADAQKVDPTKGPRVKVTRDSRIILNGQAVTWEECQAAIRQPRWDGMNLYWHHERGQKQGVWSERGSFAQALRMTLAGSRIVAVMNCENEQEFAAGWQDEDELSESEALADLVAGTFTNPDGAYGYALEWLCQVFGTCLGVIEGKNRLKNLKLDTPLSETRVPIRLPEVDDFPYISSLTAEEVQREVGRLDAMDLSYPKNTAIEQDRKSLLQQLKSAVAQHRAIVAFYY